MDNYVISVRQFTIIVFFCAIGTSILILPQAIVGEVKHDAWIACIVAILINLLIVKLYIAVGNISPNKTLVEINIGILGKWIGSIVSLTFVFFSFITASEFIYFVSSFMNIEVMHDTPTYPFSILFGLLVILGVSLGLETFARTAEILFPIFIFLFVVCILFISPQINVERLQPVLEHGPKSMLYSVLTFISFFSLPMITLLMVFPISIKDFKGAKNGFYLGTIFGGVILTLLVTLCILVLNPNSTAHARYPSYELAKLISIGNFIERIEVIMAFMWIITIFFKTVVYFYAAVIGLAQTLKIKNTRTLTLPLGFTLIILAQFIHPNIIQSDIYSKEAWLPFSATFALFLPLLLLVVHNIRKTIART